MSSARQMDALTNNAKRFPFETILGRPIAPRALEAMAKSLTELGETARAIQCYGAVEK